MRETNHEDVWGVWRGRLAWAAGGLLLVGGGLLLRAHFGPEFADAQAPAYRPAAAAAPAAPRGAVPVAAPTPAVQEMAIAAVVNGEQITTDQLAAEARRRYGKEVMENIVNKQLILQACQQRRIEVTDKELDDEIVKLAQRFGLRPDGWLTLLEQERHITREQYRLDILWPTLALRKLAADRLQVTKQEFEQAWDSEFGAKRKVRIIVIKSKTPGPNDMAAAKAKADQVRALAAASPDEFARVAKEKSDDTQSAAIGGLVPPVRKHAGDPELEKVVFGLKEGEVSQAVPAAGQFFIIKCEQHIPAIVVRPEHHAGITARLTDQIREHKLRNAAGDVFTELQKTAQIVNVFNNPELSKQMPGVAGTINGRPVTLRELGKECIARHGVEVLDGEINRKLLEQALRKRNMRVEQSEIDAEIDRAAELYGMVDAKTKQVNREAWLDKIVEEGEKTAKAEKAAPAKLTGAARQAVIDLYVSDVVWPSVALKKLVGGNVQVTQDELELGFARHYGERVEVLVCVLSDHRTATQVFDMARNNPTDQFFGQLATQYSVEPISKNNKGMVPPIRLGGGQPALEKAAFTLKRGELSDVVVAGDKYIVMRCLGRTKPMFQLAEVQGELVKVLHEEKLRDEMAKTYENLKAAAHYDNFLTPGNSHQPVKAQAARPALGTARPVPAAVPVNAVRPASATGPVAPR